MVYPTTSTAIPQVIDYKRKPRLQFLDTGLLNYILGVQADMIGIPDLSDFHRGKIIQHLVFQEIQSQNSSLDAGLHFWVRENSNSNAEVDLVIPVNDRLIPVEVKSGAQGRLRSLHQFIEASDQPHAIRLLGNHLSIQDARTASGKPFRLLNLPYYLASRITDYANWFIEQPSR